MKAVSVGLLCALMLCACSNDKHQSKQGLTKAVSQDTTSSQIYTTDTSAKKPDAEVLYKKCVACHGKDGKTIAPGSVDGVMIASFNKAQVIASLKGFRARTLSRGGDSIVMYMQTQNLSDEDIEALAVYIDAF